MAKLKTVRVVADNDAGFVVINKSDLTSEQKIFIEQEKPTKKYKGGKR